MPSPIYRLLRWSERYTKTDMIYLASGGFWLALGHGVQTLLGLGLLIAFANLLPKETYGTYQFVLSLAGVAGMFTLTGMGTALLRSTARNGRSSLRYALRTKLVWNIGIALVAACIAVYYYVNGNTTLALALCIVALFQPLLSSFELYQPHLLGSKLFRENAFWDILHRALPTAALIGALLFTDDVLTILLTFFAANALIYFLAYRHTVRHHAREHTADDELLSYSKHLTAMNVIGQTAQHLDKVLIWHFLGAAPLAAYALAQSATKHFSKVFTLMHSLTFPKIVHKSIAELQAILPRKIHHYFILVSLAVCVYILLAPLLFSMFFPTYPEAIIYTQLLALSTLAIPRQLIWQAFEAHKRKKEQYILKIASPLIRVGLLVVLLPLYGIWGAIAASLAADFCTTVIQWCFFQRMNEASTDFIRP